MNTRHRRDKADTRGADTADLRALLLASRRFRQAMADHLGLSLSAVAALGHLADSRGSLTPGELAERMQLGSGTVTAIIDRLVGDGLAERRPNPRDRRSAVVGLTASGRRAARGVERHLERAFAAAFDGKPRVPGGGPPLASLAAALTVEAERAAGRGGSPGR